MQKCSVMPFCKDLGNYTTSKKKKQEKQTVPLASC